MKITTVDNYSFRAPLLIHEEGMSEVALAACHSGEAWIQTLSQGNMSKPIKALVLPLELKTASQRYSDLFGVELLNWLRWCELDSIRWLPVIAVCWQSLTAVLRKKPDLLLVCPGTQFHQITDVLPHDRRILQMNVAAGQRGELNHCDEPALRRYTMGTAIEAAQVTYHDLANDHYAAYRLWVGYIHALEESLAERRLKADVRQALQDELERARNTPVPSVEEIKKKQRTPLFQHFKLVRSVNQIPAYPHMEGAETVFQKHIVAGLPNKARVLLVDDEFDKGVADTLLQVLFRQTAFTAQSSEQAVYSSNTNEAPKARLVCVKSSDEARNWLRYWGDLPFSDEAREAMSHGLSSASCSRQEEAGSFKNWLFETNRMVGGNEKSFLEALKQRDPAEMDASDADKYFLEAASSLLCRVDDLEGSPKAMATIMILDLRLEKGAVPELYDAGYFSSTALRREVKHENPRLPILMFTASRQAMNYASIMAEATSIDGWLCKEAPDSPEDLANSTNSLLYLVAQIHMFGGMSEWEHEGLGWDPADRIDYASFYTGPWAQSSLDHITAEATRLVELIHRDNFSKIPPFAGLKGKLKPPLFQIRHEKIESLLVARRLFVATLFMTAHPTGQSLSFDPESFGKRIRGEKFMREAARKAAKNKDTIYFREVINQKHFWFRSLDPDQILQSLLKDELLWLESQNWVEFAPNTAPIIHDKIHSALERLEANSSVGLAK